MPHSVLIIDDDHLLRAQIARYLKRKGWEVFTAADGELGAIAFEEHPTDIVVTDIVMPNREGLETIRELRKHAPKTPIIAISGGLPTVGMDCLYVARALGATEAIQKPVKLPLLLEVMERLVEKAD